MIPQAMVMMHMISEACYTYSESYWISIIATGAPVSHNIGRLLSIFKKMQALYMN